MMKSVLGIVLFLAAPLVLAGEQPAVGKAAPEFRLQDQNGDWHALSDYRGKWLAVYFYPKDDTPGCTTEACNFRDNIYAFRRIGAEVLGISLDSVDSHKAFAEKYKLPFTLLADPEAEAANAYGVVGHFGTMKIAKRQSFLVDPQGIIVKHYAKVDPEAHTQTVIADLETMINAVGQAQTTGE